jgi:hypothetical protein
MINFLQIGKGPVQFADVAELNLVHSSDIIFTKRGWFYHRYLNRRVVTHGAFKPINPKRQHINDFWQEIYDAGGTA